MTFLLILSIIFFTIFALCYKIAAHIKSNIQVVNVWSYIGSTITVLAYVLIKFQLSFNNKALILGLVTGIIVFFSTISFFYHIRKGQLSTSWTVINLSCIGFPVVASILVWHEQPSLKQYIGLALIVIALILFGRGETIKGKSMQ